MKSGFDVSKELRRQVKECTAAYSIDAVNDNGLRFSNKGAAGEVIISAEDAVVGKIHEFIVETAQYLQIKPKSADQLPVETGALQTAGKYVRSNTVGDRLLVECITATEWALVKAIGTGWTAEA